MLLANDLGHVWELPKPQLFPPRKVRRKLRMVDKEKNEKKVRRLLCFCQIFHRTMHYISSQPPPGISKSPTTPKDKGVAKRALRITGPLRQKLLTNRGQSRLFPKTQTAKRHSLTANCYSNLQRTVQQREQAPVVHEIVDQKLLVSSVVVGLQANDVRVP